MLLLLVLALGAAAPAPDKSRAAAAPAPASKAAARAYLRDARTARAAGAVTAKQPDDVIVGEGRPLSFEMMEKAMMALLKGRA